MSNNLTLIVHLESRPHKIAETKAFLLSMVEQSRPENGCVHYDLLQNNDNPVHFAFYETWTSRETLEVHLQKPHVRELYARTEELLEGAPDVRFMTMVSVPAR